jgi:hypothetical protein
VTDETGKYQLRISAKQPGALVGPNVAVVSWPVRDRAAPPPVPDAPIPLKYRAVDGNPLCFDVKAGQSHIFDLPLVDD